MKVRYGNYLLSFLKINKVDVCFDISELYTTLLVNAVSDFGPVHLFKFEVSIPVSACNRKTEKNVGNYYEFSHTILFGVLLIFEELLRLMGYVNAL